MVKMKVKLTFIEPLLGTTPGSKEIAEEFVMSQHPDEEIPKDEQEAHSEKKGEAIEKATTFFSRNKKDQPVLWNYQIEGFFKDACSMLKRIKGNLNTALKAHKKMIDGLVFVEQRQILITPPEKILKPEFLERPLRAQTLKGERIALARSEVMPAGSKVEFTIMLLEDSLVKHVRSWLDYGVLRGLGQWRNSGMGRFTWEMLSTSKRKEPKAKAESNTA